MAKRESSPGISPLKKRIQYRSGSNFNAEYTRTFDWVLASDRGKQQAYCKVCSKHFSVSHGGIDDVRQKAFRTVQRIFLKNHGFSARCPAFFFQKLNMSVSKLNRRLPRLLRVYSCQNITLLEIKCHGSIIRIHQECEDKIENLS